MRISDWSSDVCSSDLRAIIAQDVAEDVNVYASYNRGFKSGGFNPVAFTNPATKPEVLAAFEIGFKSRTADRLLQLNASPHYYIYQDIQLRTTAPPPPPGGTPLSTAATPPLQLNNVAAHRKHAAL